MVSSSSNNSNDNTPEEDFASRMRDILNAGALNVAIALGYRHGLFEVLDAAEQPLTCKELSLRAKIHPRVCCEWLGIVLSGKIVDVHHGGYPYEEERYWLPRHRGDVLCRRAGKNNLGLDGQEIPLLTSCVYQQVAESFRTGAGIPYSQYPAFQAFMGELADRKHRDGLIQEFLPAVEDGALMKRLEEGGMRVLDVGCGRGLAVTLMAQRFPESSFVGMDLDAEAIAHASEASIGLENVSFIALDCSKIAGHPDYTSSFDYVTAFDAIHDCCEPEKVLRGIWDVMKPGAKFSMIDMKGESSLAANRDHPFGPLLYTVSLMHCMQVAMVNGGRGLGMMWGRELAVEFLKHAGFRNVQVLPVPGDPYNTHYFATKHSML